MIFYMTSFRKATPEDFDSCWQLIDEARWKMIRDGRCQWTSDYPSPDIIRHDIDQGHAFVIENEGKITTYGVIAINAEPAYSQPSAHWLSHGDYFVIHRLAVSVDERGRGWGHRFIEETERHSRQRGVNSIKIDTNYDNTQMLSMMKSMGYTACGEIDYGDKGMRLAFEKLLTDDPKP
ncbi:MAG TPA: GNAT family N-acetyltransferase [Prevotella sp.]